jgi:hypothetical protein
MFDIKKFIVESRVADDVRILKTAGLKIGQKVTYKGMIATVTRAFRDKGDDVIEISTLKSNKLVQLASYEWPQIKKH